jgi:propanol-preferring alcohol dehydrogenase
MNGTDIPIHTKTQMKPATFEIPTKQRAAVKQGSGREAKTVIKEIDVPTPGPGEILVKISW